MEFGSDLIAPRTCRDNVEIARRSFD